MNIFFILCFILLTSCCFYTHSDDKIYIDEQEMNTCDDAFYIHVGDNTWIRTHSICKDRCGTFTYRTSIACSSNQSYEDEKTWKCPYCNRYWPVGSPCKNKDCPSKYKE